MSTPTGSADSADPGTSGAPAAAGTGNDGAAAHGAAAEAPFDPYRFGKPDHPVPPEYAPPGYVPDPPASPYQSASNAPGGQLGGAFPGRSWTPPSGQQGPYGQQPYGQYGYPGQYQQAPQQYAQRGNGKATAGMVLGIVSVVMFWLSILNVVLLALALVFGLLGLGEARRRGGVGRAMAVAGLACMAVGTVLTVAYTVLIIKAANDCGGFQNNNDPGFSQCLRDNIF